MVGKDVILSLVVGATAAVALFAGNWADRHMAGHAAHRVAALVALVIVAAVTGAAWLPVLMRSIQSRKAVA